MSQRAVPCGRDGHEVRFRAILLALLAEGRLPEGSVVDAGANFGHEACAFAEGAPTRRVHALDPSPQNVEFMREKYVPTRPNLLPRVAALGEHATRLRMRYSGAAHFADVTHAWPSNRTDAVDVLTVDDLFHHSGERLGFAHLDVEGHELAALKGATLTLQSSRPVVTTELLVHRDPAYTAELLGFMEARAYRSFLVEEVCGAPLDCRNLIHFPVELGPRLLGSPTLDLALSSRVMLPVDARIIPALAYPCCEHGGECCPDRQHKKCCSTGMVYPRLKHLAGVEGRDTAIMFHEQHHWVFNLELHADQVERQRKLLNASVAPGKRI